ncbi:MAG: LysE family translocator [Nitratireductor sp.]
MGILGYLTYVLALGIAAAIPGPGVAAVVARALGTGFRRSIALISGIIAGDLVYLSAAVGGLATIAHAMPQAFLAVRIAGAAYLLWLAWQFWRAGIAISDITRSPGRRDGLASFLAGLALTLGNPKPIVFYLALLPSVIDMNGVHFHEWLILCVLTVAILFAVLLPYAALAARARHFFADRHAMKMLNRIAAIAMIAAAIFVLASN